MSRGPDPPAALVLAFPRQRIVRRWEVHQAEGPARPGAGARSGRGWGGRVGRGLVRLLWWLALPVLVVLRPILRLLLGGVVVLALFLAFGGVFGFVLACKHGLDPIEPLVGTYLCGAVAAAAAWVRARLYGWF